MTCHVPSIQESRGGGRVGSEGGEEGGESVGWRRAIAGEVAVVEGCCCCSGVAMAGVTRGVADCGAAIAAGGRMAGVVRGRMMAMCCRRETLRFCGGRWLWFICGQRPFGGLWLCGGAVVAQLLGGARVRRGSDAAAKGKVHDVSIAAGLRLPGCCKAKPPNSRHTCLQWMSVARCTQYYVDTQH